MTIQKIESLFTEAKKWREEALILRAVLLDSGLSETCKWNKPCYVHGDNNICIIQRMNDFLSLMFFKGALVYDPEGALRSQGPNSRSAMRLEFTSIDEIHAQKNLITDLIMSAIDVENSGQTIGKSTAPDYPDELVIAFDHNPDFRTAFDDLTPGRRRGYLLHFNEAKQATTRNNRIAKHKDRILAGKGMQDR